MSPLEKMLSLGKLAALYTRVESSSRTDKHKLIVGNYNENISKTKHEL